MMSNSTPTGSVDEIREQIINELTPYTFNDDGHLTGLADKDCYQWIDALVKLILARETEAREEGYKKGVKILAWRIDCCTLISELSGWRGAVEMAEEEALEQMDAQLQSLPNTTKEVNATADDLYFERDEYDPNV